MKQLAANLRRYFYYYLAVIRYHLKGILVYRTDFFLRVIFILVYLFVSIGFLKVVFSKVDRILDWTWEEAFLFMATPQLVWSIGYVLFMEGLRDFTWHLVREGDLDFMLLKPINPRFQISFCQPSFNDLTSFIFSSFLLIYAIGQLKFQPQFWNIFFFVFALILAEFIYYLFAFIIITFSLWAGQAREFFEFFDRTVEFSQYPTDVFKGKLYFMFYTFIPIALFSFLPSRLLIGKAPFWMIVIPLAVAIALYFISKILFKEGLKNYSSASS